MADNIELNSGTGGSVLSTDEVTRATVVQHVQYVKLMNGTDAAIDVIPGDATNGLLVNLGTNNDVTVTGTVTVNGSGVTQPVSAASLPLPSGAATSANQTTIIGHVDGIETLLGTIDADTGTIAGAVAGAEMQCDIVAALPAGTNNIGDVDVLSIVPGTGATALGKAIDSAAGSTDTGVAVLAIRDDALSALTPIEGDYVPLRVSSTGALHVTGGGGGTQYNVDDVAGATDTGNVLLAVRDDSLATLTPIDGDYTPLRVSSTGALHVTGGGGGTEYNEDAATPATITGTATMMERDDALAALTPIEGDWAAMRCDANGALWTAVNNTVTVADGGGSLTVDNAALAVTGGGVEATALRVTIANDSTGVVSIDDNGGSITVDGTVAVSGTVTVGSHAVTNAGTFATQVDGAALTALQLIDNPVVVDDAAFTPATTSVMMAGFEFDDVTPDSVNEGDAGAARMSANRCQYVMIRDNAGNERGLNIDASGQLAVTGTVTANLAAGTNNIGDVDILSIAAGDNNIGNVDIVTMPNVTLAAGTNTNEVVGDAAHDAAIAGNPVRIGARAVTADYTSVATGDTADLIATVGGKLVIHPYAIPENYVKGATSDMAATTSTSVVAAAGAGLKNYITHILVQNSHATVGTWVNIQDGSGGTTLYTVYAAALGGGASITLPCPIATTANTALYCANVTTGANTRVSASGYKAP